MSLQGIERAFDGLITFVAILIGLCIFFVPLGMWKLYELLSMIEISVGVK
jgi:hypothetical protein